MAANTSLHEQPAHERASVRLGVAVGALVLCSQCLSSLDGFDSGPGANNKGSGGSGGGFSGAGGSTGSSAGATGGDAGAGGVGGQSGAGQGGAAGAGGKGGAVVNPAQAPPVYAATSAWCAEAKADPEIDFCADFDSEATALGAFDAPSDAPTRLATMLPTSSEASSSSNALLVYAQPSTPSDEGGFYAKLSKKFDDAASGFRLSFDFRPELMNGGGASAVVAAVEFLGLEQTYALQLTCTQGQMRLEEAYPNSIPEVPPFPHRLFSVPLNEWTRVELVADLKGNGIDVGAGGAAGTSGAGGSGGAAGAGGGGQPTAVIRTGAPGGELTQVGTVRNLSFLNGPDFNREPLLSIGIPQGEFHHTGWALRIDNVVFDVLR